MAGKSEAWHHVIYALAAALHKNGVLHATWWSAEIKERLANPTGDAIEAATQAELKAISTALETLDFGHFPQPPPPGD